MKTITIDLTKFLYYLLPIVIIYIFIFKRIYKVHKETWNKYEDYFFEFVFLISTLFTIIASGIYFVILHLLLDFNYTIKL